MICAGSRRCGRICLRLSERTSMCCFWFCTTLPATGGRWRRCCGILGAAMRRGGRGVRRSWRRCRCNMPTTRCGSRTRSGQESDAASAMARQLGFWRDELAGFPKQIELPSDRPRPAVASHRGDVVGLALSRELHVGLLGLRGQRGRACSWCCRRGLRRC